ncbi:MAG: hypothetical protein QXL78_05975 [Methanocellales archaeon]
MRIALALLAITFAIPLISSAYIPPNLEKFGQDFYTVYAEPNLTASLMESREYYRGDKSAVLIQIMNTGKIEGFKCEKEPSDANEIALAKLEMELENQATTAIGIFATLSAEEGVPINIKTGTQVAGSLRSGEISAPIQFNIEINENAKAGFYKLKLKLEYDYQKDVQVEGNFSQNKINCNYWYEKKNQTLYLEIAIEPEADFKVKEVKGNLIAGEEGVLQVIFENTGEELARDAIAQIKVVDPFSSSDYTSYLGDLKPGEAKNADFKVKVDRGAIPKTYYIRAEIKYENSKGRLITSNSLKIPVNVTQGETLEVYIQRNLPLIILPIGVLIAAVIYIAYRRGRKRKEVKG